MGCENVPEAQMKTEKKSVREAALALWKLCPVRHVIVLISLAVTGLYFLLRGNRAVMQAVCDGFVRPYQRFMGKLCSAVDVSVAEIIYAVLIVFGVVYIARAIVLLICRGNRLRRLWLTVETAAAVGLAIYAGFSLLWGVYYYGESFSEDIGIETRPISVEELYTVTAWFAENANKYSEAVPRDENGVFSVDRQEILEKAESLYGEVSGKFSYLEGPALRPKGFVCSKILSYINFTGFFFPFTGEANVNMDSPVCMLPSTVAHEIAHQRGVATEQEANFAAVLSSMENGDEVYCYSASLLAYIHLGNALYSADYEKWEQVYFSLSDKVLADFEDNSLYWDRFETPAAEVSESVYTGFLQSHGQQLGMKSYGACIDLLVAYYYETARAELEATVK